MRVFRNRKTLVFFVALHIANCSSASLENICDPLGERYQDLVFAKSLLENNDSFCGKIFPLTPPSGLSYPSPSSFANGSLISLSPSVTGKSLLFSIQPALPTGVSINTNSGLISGTYSGYAGTMGSYTVNAANTGGSVSHTFQLTFFGKPPLKTAQTQCWDEIGVLDSTCSLSSSLGQDGKLQNGTVPSFSSATLVNSSDYITVDNNTSFVWKTCNENVAFSGSSCDAPSGSADVTWSGANTACSSLDSGSGYANKKNWKLASVAELTTIINYFVTPATYDAYFPGAAGGGQWTRDSFAMAPSTDAWYLSLSEGVTGRTSQVNTNRARCVQGASVPDETFRDNGDQTITDINTGLVWQKCAVGLSGDQCQIVVSSTSMIWSSALNACNSLTLANRTWRLPSVSELKSIVNLTNTTVPINTSYFPGVAASTGYWTSTTIFASVTDAWVVHMNVGSENLLKNNSTNKQANSFDVRCVATGP
ncbi:DUF1566 domain-containing protein [Leptospira ilyithenensis]|uniref:DUF1566 domain-containing protein n=1 Tax=Leptospira ilyithenensis TaxID=2484901 RepID=A0A4R9LRQ7_9LEPT|nr:DUF1566 domain-containing protein [Leptospira ilyithenensis]TGN10582.1 DUF1566 domain-containing protein [Leptospira ilyithenensis]